jgi:hypothetical protein
MVVFWVIAPVAWYRCTNIVEVLTASIIRVMMEALSTPESLVNLCETT